MGNEIAVVGAALVREGRVLVARRSPSMSMPGMWEFPGGKIEPGETAREALHREIAEELHCEVQIGAEIVTTRHEYDLGVITLTTFYCTLVAREPERTEHSEIRWMDPTDILSLEWAPADLPTATRIAHGWPVE